MHLLMKPVTEVVYFSMVLDPRTYSNLCEQNSPVAYHPCHLTTSVLSETLVLPALVFAYKQEDRFMVRCSAKESIVFVTVCRVKLY